MSDAGIAVAPVVAIILAAGASTRLGWPKQLARVGGERLLERAVRVAREAGCDAVVVLGACAELVRAECDLEGCRVAVNADWERGMGSSIRTGIEAAEALGREGPGSATAIRGAILLTCDQPAVSAEHLLRLMRHGEAGQPVASSYAGRKGVPAYFPAPSFAALRELKGDAGARDLLLSGDSVLLPLGELDVDTAEELELAERVFGTEAS